MGRKTTNFSRGKTDFSSAANAAKTRTNADDLREELLTRARIKKAREALLDSIREVDPQWAVYQDPAKYLCMSCSRRSGKTYLLITIALLALLEENTDPGEIIYGSDSFEHAKALVWNDFLTLITEYKLDGIFDITHSICQIVNSRTNVRFRVIGFPDEGATHKVRGYSIKIAMIDEAQSLKYDTLETLVQSAIGPALRETQGRIYIAGTPSEDCSGFFYDAANGKAKTGFSTHSWTAEQNRNFPVWQKMPDDKWQAYALANLERTRIESGLALDDPKFLREYKGIWVADQRSYIYSIKPNNILQKAPDIPCLKVLGVDLGFVDSTGFSVLGYNRGSKIYQLYEDTPAMKIISDIADEIKRLHGIYVFESIIIDSASGGKNLGYEITKRFNIPVFSADKSGKRDKYMLVQSCLHSNDMYLLPKTAAQMATLIWDAKGEKENKNQVCDLSDATLYAFTRCYNYARPDPKDTTPLKSMNSINDIAQRIESQNRLFEEPAKDHNPFSKLTYGDFDSDY